MRDCFENCGVCVCVCASLHSTPFTPPTPLTPFTPLTPLTPLTDRMHVHGCQRIYILRMKNRPETVKVAPLIRNSLACVPVHRLAAWLRAPQPQIRARSPTSGRAGEGRGRQGKRGLTSPAAPPRCSPTCCCRSSRGMQTPARLVGLRGAQAA